LVRNVLSGTNLGHPLHPALTDLPIGAWGMATLLDRGGPRCEPGADLLVGAGFSVLVAGAYLGGHLSFARAVNVNRTAVEDRPRDWTPVLSEAELGEGQHRRVNADGAPVLVARVDGQVWALANTCSHAGGPLDEGTVRDGCVVCPWHGSTFRLADGEIVRGPASAPQPSYETRVRDGKIELRALA
jgi:nitrite reductase/ring-hydroxylating ferredoxin subunit